MIKYSIFKLLFLGIFFSSVIACDNKDEVTPEIPDSKTIAQIAADDSQFSTLVSALDRVNLVSVLDGAGSYTVFAPTNAAFQKLGVDLSSLTDEMLTEVLLNHVVGAKVLSTDIAEGQTYVSSEAATGPNNAKLSLLVEKDANGVMINGKATVSVPDINASNGVIHVVDEVVMPLDVVGHALANKHFSTLVDVMGVAEGDLVSVLSGEGPFTVFAPINEAFSGISEVTSTLNPSQLAKVLTYHVTGGNVLSSNLSDAMMVTTVNGEEFMIHIAEDAVMIKDANGGSSNIVLVDVQAKNGVIHVLDQVIIPENL